jgi:protein-disulfide isomerase
MIGSSNEGWTRRAMLTALGTGVVSAGCLSASDGSEDPETLDEHPAAENVNDSPTLGPPVGDAATTVVAFEDPSCSSCAEFASGTLPELRDRAIEPGDTSYVWRATPGVEPWGEPAAGALLAVRERDPDAFWTVKGFYYAERSSITVDTVYDRTAAFVDEETDAAPTAVLDAMAGEDDGILEHIERDETAATASDVETLPTFVLFRGDEYVTTVVGNHSYEVFEGALEL